MAPTFRIGTFVLLFLAEKAFVNGFTSSPLRIVGDGFVTSPSQPDNVLRPPTVLFGNREPTMNEVAASLRRQASQLKQQVFGVLSKVDDLDQVNPHSVNNNDIPIVSESKEITIDEPSSDLPTTSTTTSATTSTASSSTIGSPTTTTSDKKWTQLALVELAEVAACAKLVSTAVLQSNTTAEEIVLVCDALDAVASIPEAQLWVNQQLSLRRRALEAQRYELLATLLGQDYEAYIATASFLSPSRIPRRQLPNLEDVPYDPKRDPEAQTTGAVVVDENGVPLVSDCELDDMKYEDSPLDKLLLSLFRKFVVKNTGGVTSEQKGILGLVEQGRTYMLQPGQTAEAQHKMVYDTLGGLLTPALPPFYRIFMTGIVPSSFPAESLAGKQLGPWFYAPWLTSFVTPPFFGFLVGPSYPNRRKDGQLGGLVVEKCKFLQESNCKGLCLHQCKLPAQQFFKQELGLPLTVSPNFATQECQWSFGQEPLEPSEDPSFPKGCLEGCTSRKTLAAAAATQEGPVGARADLCNY